MANEQHHPGGWLQDGSLLYRLTDDDHPVNRDEINVTMANGSRSMESCTRRAGELLDSIHTGQAALFAAADTSKLPEVPDGVLCYVHAYGDSRADDDGRSGLRIGELILALRRWAKSIAAPTTQAAPQQEAAIGARCKVIENCKSCQHSVGRQSCALADRKFDSLSRSSAPPEWCPLPLYTAPQPAPVAQGDARAEQSLLKVLTAVQRYLPPDGPSAKDTLAEIIGIVDPWPLGDLEGKA